MKNENGIFFPVKRVLNPFYGDTKENRLIQLVRMF